MKYQRPLWIVAMVCCFWSCAHLVSYTSQRNDIGIISITCDPSKYPNGVNVHIDDQLAVELTSPRTVIELSTGRHEIAAKANGNVIHTEVIALFTNDSIEIKLP